MGKSLYNDLLYIFTLAILLSAMIAGEPGATWADEAADKTAGEKCVECHKALWEAVQKKAYIHKPFLEKRCVQCHADAKVKAKEASFLNDRSIRWIDRSIAPAEKHWFVFAPEKINEVITLEVCATNNEISRRELQLPPLEDLEEIKDDETPPVIKDVKLLEITKGLFVNAVIAWETDELSSGKIYFGKKNLKKTSYLQEELSLHHIVTLAGLKGGKKYKFAIEAADLFGNTARSDVMAFSTAKSFVRKNKKTPDEQSVDEEVKEPLQLESLFFQGKDKYMVKVVASQPVQIGLGTPRFENAEEKKALATTGPIPENHNMKDSLETNNTVCLECHGNYIAASTSHPVNVPPRPGMKIPSEYPTLANGNITCMTCHASHSSNIPNRLIKSNKRDLCVGCHKELANI